jgi:hypothetical protein
VAKSEKGEARGISYEHVFQIEHETTLLLGPTIGLHARRRPYLPANPVDFDVVTWPFLTIRSILFRLVDRVKG